MLHCRMVGVGRKPCSMLAIAMAVGLVMPIHAMPETSDLKEEVSSGVDGESRVRFSLEMLIGLSTFMYSVWSRVMSPESWRVMWTPKCLNLFFSHSN